MGAPTVEPWTNSRPTRDLSTGFVVTLWNRLDHDPTARAPGSMVAGSLRELHKALSLVEIDMPDFRLGLRRARTALSDDDRVAALAADDIALLRNAFDALLPQLEDRTFPQCSLHGEPHDGNWLFTPSGIRWIDFENVCSGPLEWDLAFLSDSARRDFTSVDHELLALLSVLNSARVATWCWAQARFPEMRRHGEHHLNIVKSRWIEP
jgi:thiamine kinase-like enzyme